MANIEINNTIFTVGTTKDNANWENEEIEVIYSVMRTEDGIQPTVTLLGKDFPKSEIHRMLSIMDKVEELSEIVGES